MKKIFDKIFLNTSNQNYINLEIKKISQENSVKKIFKAINSFSNISEVRYVGGFVRNIIEKKNIEDIDLATNLNPVEVCNTLEINGINYHRTGISHGTVTATIDDKKFEITSLRKDLITDGRHAKVQFSGDWKEDALRRDFTINSIYADKEGNLFDPFNGKTDLENGQIKFIGEPEKRIEEDYLRILRYIRFFLNYSQEKHNPKIIRIIKKNLQGVLNLSSERLLIELKKLVQSGGFLRLYKDKECLEIIKLIFPQLKNLNIFYNLNKYAESEFFKVDFIFLISLMIIDKSDNSDYFIYKFNLSKKDEKRIKFLDGFYKKNVNIKFFNEKNLNYIFYFNGLVSLIDIIQYKLFKSKKVEKDLVKLINIYQNKKIPKLPFRADMLINKYNILPGKILGDKLKLIEEKWVKNNFNISEKEIKHILHL